MGHGNAGWDASGSDGDLRPYGDRTGTPRSMRSRRWTSLAAAVVVTAAGVAVSRQESTARVLGNGLPNAAVFVPPAHVVALFLVGNDPWPSAPTA